MSQVPSNNVEYLASSARNAMQSGQAEQAAQIWLRVLSLDPQHPSALLHLGQHALMRRDFTRAQNLLTKAARADPANPSVPLNLAFVARAQGDNAGEMNALTVALTIDPYFYPALLAKAMLLERMGQSRQAARVYKDVLAIAPPPENRPAAMREPLARAEQAITENAAALAASLDLALEETAGHYPANALRRFEACKNAAIGKRKIYTQQPSVLNFPFLPAIEFYDDGAFPWLPKLEAVAGTIREEFLKAYHEDNTEFRPYVAHPAGAPIAQWADLNHSPKWSALHLWRDGKRLDENCLRCPYTAAAVAEIPMIQIPNFGPTVLFSVLAPRAHIPAHSSSTNARLVVHLPLIVPRGCRFRVGGQTREWEEGKAWIFDDTIEHEAWNESDQLRVILMIDVWNPYLTEPERSLVSLLLNGIRDYYSQL